MAVTTYTPPSTKIVHWTGVDFSSRPTAFAPIHLVQYDQSLPIIAVSLYNAGQVYKLPSTMDANILVGKRDGTFVSNPALGCNSDRTVLYFEATYQMLYFDRIIKPVVEIKLSDTESAGSSPITIIVDRNPVQEGAKESSNEYKSAEQFRDEALRAKDQAEASAEIAVQASQAASKSEKNAKESEQNARDYAYAGVELMESLKSSNSVQERMLDSNGETILDANEKEVMGAIQYATMADLIEAQKEIEILRNRKNALEAREGRSEEKLQVLTQEQMASQLDITELKEKLVVVMEQAIIGVELMESLKSSNSVQERMLDSNGETILDANEKEVMGAIQYATMADLIEAQKEIEILRNRKNALEAREGRSEEKLQDLDQELDHVIEHAILDSEF